MSKKLVLVFTALTLTASTGSHIAYCQGYVFFSGGGGGPARAENVGVEGGKIFTEKKYPYLLGGSLSVAFNGRKGENIGTFLETSIRNEQEINGAAGLRLVKGLFIVGTAGLSVQSEKDVINVPGTPTVIEEVPLNKYFSASGQLRYVYKRFMFGAGYHSRRGVLAGLGFAF